MKLGSTTRPPDDDPKESHATFSEDVKRQLRRIGANPSPRELDLILSRLVQAALNFRRNWKRDLESKPVSNLLRAFEALLEVTDERLAIRVRALSIREIGVLWGKFPGPSYALQSGDAEDAPLVIPDHAALTPEATKNLLRQSVSGTVALRPATHLNALVAAASLSPGYPALVVNILFAAVSSARTQEQQATLLAIFSQALAGKASGPGFTPPASIWPGPIDLRQPNAVAARMDALAGWILQRENTGAMRACLSVAARRLMDVTSISAQAATAMAVAIARHDPAAFRKHIACVAIPALARQFQVDKNRKSRGRDERRWTTPPASWQLIVDVLDAVRPPETGALDRGTKQPLVDLVNSVHSYAAPESGHGADDSPPEDREAEATGQTERADVPNRPNRVINEEHVSLIATLRHEIYFLNAILSDREAKLRAWAASNDAETRKRAESILQTEVTPVQTWRRELERRLRQGDYEKGRPSRGAPSGPRIKLPKMPRLGKATPAEKAAEIIELARQLTDKA